MKRNRRISLLLLEVLLLPALLWAANTTIYRVPSTTGSGAATYNTDMSTFLQSEDAARQGELPLFPDGVVAQQGGGLHGTAASMTSPPFATTAYTPAGNRLRQASMSINYATQGCPSAATAWVMASGQTATTVGTFTRVPGSIYYTDCVSGATAPTLPNDSLLLMRVTLSGSQIAAVQDRAVRSLAATATSASESCLAASTVVMSAGGDVFVDNTAGGVTVLGANTKRCQALITNNGTADMRCAPTTLTVSATVGYPIKAGQTLTMGLEGRESWKCARTTSTSTAAAIAEAVTP
jgi:hypothetical protein